MSFVVEKDIPKELRESVQNFNAAISQIELILQSLLLTSRTDVVEKLPSIDAAKLDFVGAFTLNSLFWMYLNVCGINPKEHQVKDELDRLKLYFKKIKYAEDLISKPKPQMDIPAAKRFIKGNLSKSDLWANSPKMAQKAEQLKKTSLSHLKARSSKLAPSSMPNTKQKHGLRPYEKKE